MGIFAKLTVLIFVFVMVQLEYSNTNARWYSFGTTSFFEACWRVHSWWGCKSGYLYFFALFGIIIGFTFPILNFDNTSFMCQYLCKCLSWFQISLLGVKSFFLIAQISIWLCHLLKTRLQIGLSHERNIQDHLLYELCVS